MKFPRSIWVCLVATLILVLGFVYGLSILCHYNLIWFALVVLAGEACFAPRASFSWRSYAIFLTGLALPVAACEATTHLIGWALGPWAPGVHGYLWEFWETPRLLGGVFSHADSSPSFYLAHLIRTEGAVFAGLSAAAVGALAWVMRRQAWRDLTGPCLVSLSMAAVFLLYQPPSFRACRTILASTESDFSFCLAR